MAGSLAQPSWVKGSSRSDFTKHMFAEALPEHFFSKHRHNTIQYLTKSAVRTAGKQGGMKWKHPFLICMTGSCEGSRDGCKATYCAGILEDYLIDLVKHNTDSVQFSMTIGGDLCTHVWKAK